MAFRLRGDVMRQVGLGVSFALGSLTVALPIGATTAVVDARTHLAEIVMQVVINRVVKEEAVVLLRDGPAHIFATADQLRRWRIRPPVLADRMVSGVEYFDVFSLDGAAISINETRQELEVTLPANAFETTQRANEVVMRPIPEASRFGSFLTYDAIWQHTPEISDPLATFELGAFNRFGMGSSQFFMRGRDRRGIRLETFWSKDFPEYVATLRVGDSISRGADGWGRSLRFGGVQFGTNFATRPGLSLLPMQTVSGSAVVPSTVDVFVNNALVTQLDVPPGPFSIGNIPISSGPGTLRVVVRDLLGREQIVEQSVLGSSMLLSPNLNDYSFEFGRLRRSYGAASDDYGELFSSLTWRRGLSDTLTAEAHLEASENRAVAASVGAAVNVGRLGIVSLTAIGSDHQRGAGSAWSLAIQRPGQRVTTAVVAQYSSPEFWQLGQLSTDKRSRLSASAIVGVPLGHAGSINVAYLKRSFHERASEPIEIVTLGWSSLLLRRLYAGFSLRHTLGTSKSSSVGFNFSLLLDPRTSGSAFLEGESRNVSIQRSLPVGSGWGYRGKADNNDTIEAGTSYQNDDATFSVDASHQRGTLSMQIAARGSLLWFDRTFFGSRQLSDGFAVVRVGRQDGVRVYNGNQWVATTDKRGLAIVPKLLPYQENVISIDDRDLSFDIEIADLRKIAVPQYRSGVVLDFDIRSQRPAELRVVQEDGMPIPAGSSVWVNESKQEFRVGFDGRLYLTGLQNANRIRIHNGPFQCGLSLPMESADDPVPDLGTFTCLSSSP
jgi:outer membrane usher protein